MHKFVWFVKLLILFFIGTAILLTVENSPFRMIGMACIGFATFGFITILMITELTEHEAGL